MSILKKDGYDFVFDSSFCKDCGGKCCIGESGYIWISQKEIEKLTKYLQLEISQFSKTYLEKIGYKYSLKEKKITEDNYACIFFDLDKKQCSVYEFRPNQCRTFPFWEYFKTNKEELLKECKAILLTRQ